MPKLTLKTLKHEKIEVEVPTGATVLEIKKAVETLRPEFLVGGQKIVFSGKVLADSDVPQYRPEDFMVVMYRKPAEAPAASPAPRPTPTPAPAAAVVVPSTPSAAAAPAPAVSAPEPAPAVSAVPPPSERAELVIPPHMEAVIGSLTGMGFSREQSYVALQLAEGNPNGAVELLLSGAPLPSWDELLRAEEASAEEDGEDDDDDDDEAGELTLEALRNHPQMAQFRAMVQANPAVLQPILTSLSQSEPQLFNLIAEHQDEFMALLNEPVDPSVLQGLAQQMGQHSAAHEDSSRHVSASDREAIERLVAMGFDRNLVIQAYFACDKDENVTANYLLEHGHEFDD